MIKATSTVDYGVFHELDVCQVTADIVSAACIGVTPSEARIGHEWIPTPRRTALPVFQPGRSTTPARAVPAPGTRAVPPAVRIRREAPAKH